MNRQSRARWLAGLTAGVVVSLAAVFAFARNPGGAAQPAATAPAPDARVAAGRAAFERLNCMNCHSVAGKGNPANPLDGVGARLDAQGLRDWTLGQGAAAEKLSAGARRQKAPTANDPELPALLAYLASLK
ncbi:cytochrome c [Ramlibacter sp. AW1]|uniref:Cytochrome c n=1 Tax=Ramlibacter aurantiacus TaxID=2801330 RepID=A0A936ZV11_9BURK|nr:cytochrome c [Ramlibacter aurantiacus]MBL0423101.1 cytochrome c [Ramlibacter aurantiacus]